MLMDNTHVNLRRGEPLGESCVTSPPPVPADDGRLSPQVAASHHAALRGERLLPARHELAERHVQPAPAGRATGAARARLPALRARAHPGREAGW